MATKKAAAKKPAPRQRVKSTSATKAKKKATIKRYAKLRKTTQIKANIRREKVADGVVQGKTEKQIAGEIGISRDRVTQIKAEPDFQARIAARCKDAANLTTGEVIGTLASHLRIDVTDLLPDDGGIVSAIKASGLGHLVKKIKIRRVFDPETQQPFELVEIEPHSSQNAATQLSKILGIEQLPRANDADKAKWLELAEKLAKKYDKPIEDVKRDIIARKPEAANYLM